MSSVLTVCLLILVRILESECDYIGRPTSTSEFKVAVPNNPYLPAIPSNPQTFRWSKSGEIPRTELHDDTPKWQTTYPKQPVFHVSSPKKLPNEDSISIYSSNRIFAHVKPETDDQVMNHDDHDASSTYLTRHDRKVRSLNTNKNFKSNEIHGWIVPDIDSETLKPMRPQSREVILFRVSASGLPNMDLFGGEADPFIQIYYSNGSSPDHYENFARTVTLNDNHEPVWDEIVEFDIYLRGTMQKWKFELRDHDANDWDDQIGFAFINVDECVWESRSSGIIFDESACSAQITSGNGVLFVQIL